METAELVSPICPHGVLFDRHGSKLYFAIPKQRLALSAMFDTIEQAKARLGILEYSLSQTSLEQVRAVYGVLAVLS